MAYVSGARPSSSSALHPLDQILGTAANVRVLRVLAEHLGQLSSPDIAKRSGLSRPGAWKALRDLVDMGIVGGAGTGKALLYQLDTGHPLAASLVSLFTGERDRLRGFLKQVRLRARDLGPEILAVWMYGSVARQEDAAASDVDIAILVNSVSARPLADELAARLEKPAEELRFRPSVIHLTRSELRKLARSDSDFWQALVRDSIVLQGREPEAFVT